MIQRVSSEERDLSVLYRWIILGFLLCILVGVLFAFIVFPLFTGHVPAPLDSSEEPSSELLVSSCQVLIRAGTYVLNASLISEGTSTCIKVMHPDVVLDCRGHTILFNTSLAKENAQQYLFFSDQPRTILRNCFFEAEKGSGIFLGLHAADSEILASSVARGAIGLYLDHPSDVHVALSSFALNDLGIESLGTSGLVLESTNVSFNDDGMHLLQSERWVLRNNLFLNNTRGVYAVQSSVSGLGFGVRNTTFIGHAELGMFIGSSSQITLRDNLFQENVQGLVLSNASSHLLYHNSFVRQSKNATLFLEGSLNNQVMHARFEGNGQEEDYQDERSLNNFFFVLGSPQIPAFAEEEGSSVFPLNASSETSSEALSEIASDSPLPFWGALLLGALLVVILFFAFWGMMRRPSWSRPPPKPDSVPSREHRIPV